MQSFSFNQPGLTILLIFAVLPGFFYPLIQLRRGHGDTPLRDRVLSWWPGAPSLFVLVLLCIIELVLLSDSYSAFWSLEVERDQVMLGYWAPRRDRLIGVTDIEAIHLTRAHYDAGTRGVEERLYLTLLTASGDELQSVMILDEVLGLAAANAIAEVSGKRPRFFYRDGRFGDPRTVEPQAL